MRLVNIKVRDEIHAGIFKDNKILDITHLKPVYSKIPRTTDELIKIGGDALKLLEKLSEQSEGGWVEETSVTYAPCVLNPGKILCVGLNYYTHGQECKMEIPQTPTLFSKFNNSLASHRQPIKLPDFAEKFDYEAELVIVMGAKTYQIAKEDAFSHVFGFTAGNDLSARDLQLRTSQWLLGKTCNLFAPIGPCLVTADAINPNSLKISCSVNGQLRQSSCTDQMIFDCESIISYVSEYIPLEAGDLIFTGTPSGVIMGYKPDEQKWLKPGDRVEVNIEKIGSLINVFT